MTTEAQTTQSQLTLTDKAAAEVVKFIAAEDVPADAAGLRISVMPGGCSGFKYSLNVEEKAARGRRGPRPEHRAGVRGRIQPAVPERRHGRLRLVDAGQRIHVHATRTRPAAAAAGAASPRNRGGAAGQRGRGRGSCGGYPPSFVVPPRSTPLRGCMAPLDLTVILAYFALTLGAGLWVSRSQTTAGDYFLGARNLPAWAILFSIVATETSAITVISVPGLGARGDLTFLQLTFGYLIGRIRRRALAAPRLLPRRPGNRLPAHRDAGSGRPAGGSSRSSSC